MVRINLFDEDLKANRNGRLSSRQRRAVRSQQLLFLLGTVGLVACAMSLVAALLLKLLIPTFAARGELLVAAPVLLFWVWMLRRMPVRWRKARRDLEVGQVESVEGPVHADVEHGVGIYRPVRHYIYVDDFIEQYGPVLRALAE